MAMSSPSTLGALLVGTRTLGSTTKGRRRSGTTEVILERRLRAEHGCLQLIGREHQRWHVEVAVEEIANSGLAADWHSLTNEVGDIAVNRALRNFQLLGKLVGGDRPARPPQDLDDLKQSIGTAHGSLLSWAASMLPGY